MRHLWIVLVIALLLTSTGSAQDSRQTECSQPDLARSQLVGGIEVEIVSDVPAKLYAEASLDSQLVAQMPTGTVLFLTSGPLCHDGDIWWQGQFNLQTVSQTRDFGWITEFDGDKRQLSPRIPTLNPTLPRGTPSITSSNLSRLVSQVEMEPLGRVLQLIWSPDSEYLAINNSFAVWVYHLAKPGTLPRPLPKVALDFWNNIGAVAFSPDSQTIAMVGLQNGDLHRWSLIGEDEKTIKTQAADYAGTAAIAPDLSRWAIAHWDGSISLWDASTGAKTLTFQGHSQNVGGLEFTPDGSILISTGSFPYSGVGDDDTTVRLWEVKTGRELAVLDLSPKPYSLIFSSSRIAVSRDSRTAVVFGTMDEWTVAVYRVDLPHGSIGDQFVFTDQLYILQDAAFNADNSVLAVNATTSIRFLDPTDGSELARLPFDDFVQAIAFSPDGRWLVVAQEAPDFGKSKIQFWGVP